MKKYYKMKRELISGFTATLTSEPEDYSICNVCDDPFRVGDHVIINGEYDTLSMYHTSHYEMEEE